MDNELPPSPSQEPTAAPGQASAATPPPLGSVTPPPPIIPPRLAAVPPARNYGWKITAGVLAGLLVLSLFTNFWHFAQSIVPRPLAPGSHHAGPRLEEAVVEQRHSANKILVVRVEGIITTDLFYASDQYGQNYDMVQFIRDQFKMAARDSDIKAVILKVESPGGEVLASDDINRIITQFQAKTGKPVVASMGSMAASGGYYVSAPCRWIVANQLTLTGSIGVIFHSWNFRALMDKIGIRPEVYKSGQYKDMLSFDKKETTPEEREMIQQLINETFARFKSVVADGREWAYGKNKDNKDAQGRALSENWTDYADGRVLSGKQAHELGFVDELGNFETAASRARKLANIEDATLVRYQQVFDLSSFFRLFGKTDSAKIKVDLGMDAPKLKAGHLYFLAPTFVH